MTPALPAPAKIKINQHLRAYSPDDAKALNHLLIIARNGDEKALAKRPGFEAHAKRLKGREKESVTLPAGEILLTIGRIAEDATPFEMLEAARKWIATLRSDKAKIIGLTFETLDANQCTALTEAVTAAILAAEFPLPKITAKPDKHEAVIRELNVFDLAAKVNLARTEAAAEGTNIARWLAALPGNYLTPAKYRKYAEMLAKEYGWQTEFLSEAELKKKKAGAFLAVTQGSEDRDAGILHLSYKPEKAKKNAKPIALIGKGLCFDTGGTNLKSAHSMFGMHGDMQGSAVALGTLAALTKLRVNFPMDCWLALAQNHIGPKAYKQNDVVTASDGTSIEVVHTDAEGRMVLADTLAIASAKKPGLMMDYATLTGACVYALGTRYSGVFTNREDRIFDLIAAGKRSGERVWPFPQDRDYDTELESKVADIKQCLIPGEADHILAGRFLSRFVKNNTPWVHVDLAAAEAKGGLAHVPTEVTGFGVRFSVEYLLSHHDQ